MGVKYSVIARELWEQAFQDRFFTIAVRGLLPF